MLDALPYLIVTLRDRAADVPLPPNRLVAKRSATSASRAKSSHSAFGGIEQKSRRQTQPKGKEDLEKLDEMTRAGWCASTFQHGDGGWGWWKKATAIIT